MKKTFSRLSWRIGCALALAVVLFGLFVLSLTGLSLLRTRAQSRFAEMYANVIPLPAARVPGGWVLYRDVLDRWKRVDAFRDRVASLPSPEGQTLRSREELQKEAYEQLIRERFVEVLAEEDHFILTKTYLDTTFESLLLRQTSSTDIGEAIRLFETATGVASSVYKDTVIRPALLETALKARAEIAGIMPLDWQKQLEERLHSKDVARFLSL